MAARELAPRPEGSLLIVGAGAQGRSHLEAFREGLGVREAYVFSRTHESAEALAAHAEGLGIGATIVEGPGAAPAEVSLVVTATTSREPVLPEAVTEGTFVAAVGSLEPGPTELPPGLISGAKVRRRYDGGGRGGGRRPDPSREGRRLPVVRRDGAWEVPRGWYHPTGTVVFKSVGHSLWDLAAARTAFPR